MKNIFLSLFLIFSISSFAEKKITSTIIDKQIEYKDNLKCSLSPTETFDMIVNQFAEKTLNKTGKIVKMDKDNQEVCFNVWQELILWSSTFSSNSIYINYNLSLNYEENACDVKFSNITFCEMENIDEKGRIKNRDDIFSGEYILVDKKYKSLLKRNLSDIVTEKTEDHFNMMNDLLFKMLN